MSEVFAMGGYGLYVWSVVGVFVLITAWLSLYPYIRHKRLRHRINVEEDE